MKFTLPLAALFAVAAAVPQTPAQTTAAVEALSSYIAALETNSDLLSIASKYATDTKVIASISAWEASVSSQIEATQTPAANFLDSLPTGVRSFYSSVYQAEASIFSANGFKDVVPTSTSKGAAAPRETGAMKAAGAVAMGFVGAMVVL